jgi:hypothetical protein
MSINRIIQEIEIKVCYTKIYDNNTRYKNTKSKRSRF